MSYLPNRVAVSVEDLGKSFTLHMHGGTRLPVVSNVGFVVHAGECVVLGGPSGAGKSSILKMLYGNYLAGDGHIRVRHGIEMVDIVGAEPRTILDIRRRTLGYVSQFLRVIPRVPALEIVAEPAMAGGVTRAAALSRAAGLLQALNLPERLWKLPPATFSGGEQQRVNIARGFAGEHSILILDEPTASLDAANREAVIELMAQRKASGTAFVGIFHDEEVRARVADRVIDVSSFAAREAA
ncbi:MAG: phosphonate C-P lyase system protein PhnL [Bosea sp. (in: a-proteobacteria)]